MEGLRPTGELPAGPESLPSADKQPENNQVFEAPATNIPPVPTGQSEQLINQSAGHSITAGEAEPPKVAESVVLGHQDLESADPESIEAQIAQMMEQNSTES